MPDHTENDIHWLCPVCGRAHILRLEPKTVDAGHRTVYDRCGNCGRRATITYERRLHVKQVHAEP